MARPRRAIHVEVLGTPAVKRAFVKIRELVPETAAQLIEKAGNDLVLLAQQNLVRMNPPGVDTGLLLISITARFHGTQSTVGSSAKHAPFVEFGTRPHWPPLDAIRAWCIRKFGSDEMAFPVARKIAERGTRPRPFLSKAFKTVQRRLLGQMRTALKAQLQKVSR